MTESLEAGRRVVAGGRVPVVSSDSHTVLCQLPAAGATAVPAAAGPTGDCWDEHHVRLPCSPQSLYPQHEADGQSRLVQRWTMVQEALLQDIKTSADLENAIKSYNSRYKDKWDFAGLRYFIDEVLADEERQHLFRVTLPQMCRLALRLPELLPSPLPLLVRHRARSVTLSQLQVAALLANAFFCTFPRRNAAKRGEKPAEYSTYPDINFNRLFTCSGGRRSGVALSAIRIEKLKCLLHYFHRVLRREPTGIITFTRRYLTPSELPDWSAAEALLPALTCHSDRLIEDQDGMLQVDFANKFVGGGVLGEGCVQEEIRFLINPELIVTRLFTEVLNATECLVVTGCERFSQFEGYAGTFKWTAKNTDSSSLDQFGRRSTQVVALDAVHFFRASHQYEKKYLLREMNKAYVGFSSEDDGSLPPVATGNWGCGAFNGDQRLKALLQLMAAAMAHREVVYLTFGDEKLRDELRDAHAFLQQKKVTVGQLYKVLLQYGGLYASRTQRPNLLRFLRDRLTSGDGSDYGSDTESESERQPEQEPGPETEELTDLDPGEFSQEMTEETSDAARTAPSRNDHAVSDMDTESESYLPAGRPLDATADQHSGSDVKRVRRIDSGSDTDISAAAELESGNGPRTGAAAGTNSRAGAAAGNSSTAKQFERFEVISETTRQHTALRQSKITGYLKK